MYFLIIGKALQYLLSLGMLSLSAAAITGRRWLKAPNELLPSGGFSRFGSAAFFFLAGALTLAGAFVPFFAFFSAVLCACALAFLALRVAPLKSVWAWLLTAGGATAAVTIAAAQPLGLKVLLLPKADDLPVSAAPFRVIKTYDEGLWFEGIATDNHGTLFLSGNRGLDFSRSDYYRSAHGEVIRRSPEGDERSIFQTPAGTTAGVIALSSDGMLYMTSHGDTSCVWRIAPDGTAEKIAQLPSGAWPNGIDVGPDKNVFVADSALGVVWRVDPLSKKFERAIEDPLLSARPWIALAPGVNGIHFNDDALYVTVSDRATVLRYRRQDSGSFSRAEVVATGVPGDDFAIGGDGSLYVTTHPYNTLVRIGPDRTRTIIGGAHEHIVGATDAVFGKGLEDRGTLYVVTDGGAFTGGPKARGELIAIDVSRFALQETSKLD